MDFIFSLKVFFKISKWFNEFLFKNKIDYNTEITFILILGNYNELPIKFRFFML